MYLGEFIRCLGCWFYMGCWVEISNRSNWWSTAEPTISGGAPFRLNNYMSRTRFDGILVSIRYIDQKVIGYQDGFVHTRKIEEAWNLNMAEQFNPQWINVLDESMMECFGKYAPRFMFVGRKPHHFVNERHTICCGLTFVLWIYQIVEGKDIPQSLGQKEYNQLVKTVSLMLRICRPIFGSDKDFYWTVDFVSPKLLHSSKPKVYMLNL